VVWAAASCSGDDTTSSIETDAPPVTATGTAGTTPEQRLVWTDFDAGDCVTWDPSEEGHDVWPEAVDCAEPHLIQLTAEVAGPDVAPSTYPTQEQWDAHRLEHCGPAAVEFLGHPLDPHGRYGLDTLIPLAESWDDGFDVVWCGLTAATSGPAEEALGTRIPFTGDARDVDHTIRHAPGTCIASGPPATAAMGVVACTEPHDMEVVSELDLSDRAAPPAPDDMSTVDACIERARTYTGADVVPPWAAGPTAMAQQSWDAGSRTVHCILFQPDADGWATVHSTPAPRA
jgi:hypothetical protein